MQKKLNTNSSEHRGAELRVGVWGSLGGITLTISDSEGNSLIILGLNVTSNYAYSNNEMKKS